MMEEADRGIFYEDPSTFWKRIAKLLALRRRILDEEAKNLRLFSEDSDARDSTVY